MKLDKDLRLGVRASVVALGALSYATQAAAGHVRRRPLHARDRGLRDGARGARWWRYVLVGMFLFVGGESYGTGQTLLYSVHGGGVQAYASFGSVLASLGDVTGDGIPDLAVGYRDTGRVVVFSGADGRRLRTLWSPRSHPSSGFGSALASLGDVNDDGIPDLAVGVPLQDLAGEDGCDSGQVEVLSGADGRHLRTLRAPSPQSYAYFGSALARLGDVNDDGIADLAVGVLYQDDGQVEVFSGADGRHLRTLRASRPQAGASFGWALARLGDVTGDGIPDLAVGCPDQDDGQVEVFSGADGRHLRTLRASRPQAGGVLWLGSGPPWGCHRRWHPGPGRGRALQDLAGKDCCDHGQVEVLSGADGRHLHTLRAPRPQAFAFFGSALARLGDVNDDGIADLAVGVPSQDVAGMEMRARWRCCRGPMGAACAPCGLRDRRRRRTLAGPWPAWGMSPMMASRTWLSACLARMWQAWSMRARWRCCRGPMGATCAPCGLRGHRQMRTLAVSWSASGMSTMMASLTWP